MHLSFSAMSVRVWYDVWCDGPGCSAWSDLGGGRTRSLARAMAKRYGWTRKGGQDFCPKCTRFGISGTVGSEDANA